MLFRAIFWFSLVVMLVPVKNDRLNSRSEEAPSVQTLALIQSIASDLSGFCTRNPDSCAAATDLARKYGARVQAHAKYLGEYLASEPDNKTADQLTTGTVQSSQ